MDRRREETTLRRRYIEEMNELPSKTLLESIYIYTHIYLGKMIIVPLNLIHKYNLNDHYEKNVKQLYISSPRAHYIIMHK